MDEQRTLGEILNGQLRFLRFTSEEQSGSSRIADRLLWLALLRGERELEESHAGAVRVGQVAPHGGTPPPYRFLDSLAQPLPESFDELAAQLGIFIDRGRENAVFDSGDGFVLKLRPMVPSILSGYMAPLANIVYHNRLFPNERYTLENIFVDSSSHRYYLLIKQELVDILLDDNGVPVKPTAQQIREAIDSLSTALIEYEQEDDVCEDSDDSTDSDSPWKMKFYSKDYFVSDLQPGRNSVIDARTLKVRFIDLKVTLNDPDGPITPVSRIGCRHENSHGLAWSAT